MGVVVEWAGGLGVVRTGVTTGWAGFEVGCLELGKEWAGLEVKWVGIGKEWVGFGVASGGSTRPGK